MCRPAHIRLQRVLADDRVIYSAPISLRPPSASNALLALVRRRSRAGDRVAVEDELLARPATSASSTSSATSTSCVS